MKLRIRGSVFLLATFLAIAPMTAPFALAQQTLGGITGTVTDASGAIVVGAAVTLIGDETKLTRTQTTTSTGFCLFVNLPIGSRTERHGLFYNGSNPLQLRGGYAPSDFDRTHVFNVDYHYELPKFFGPSTWEGRVADGWAVQGLIVSGRLATLPAPRR